jgi:precorrin-3B synthase
VLTSPLLGLQTPEHSDLCSLAVDLRAAFTNNATLASLGPKVSVIIDDGSTLHLDGVPGDVRLRVDPESSNALHWHLSMAGPAATATGLGWVEPRNALEAILRVLAAIAQCGVAARARDVANGADRHALRLSLAGLLSGESPPAARPAAEPIGTHPLKDGRVAQGVALAFGHAEAAVLERLMHAAARCGAGAVRPAPGRALLIIGLAESAADEVTTAAAAAGFVVRADDVRRSVVACAGAPACGSALLSTRQLAPAIARAAGPLLDGSLLIHVSGCPKGCAHPGAAALTLVGPDRLVVQGRACDPPQGTASADDFMAGLSRLHVERRQSQAGRERSADMLSRLGATRVHAAMRGADA